MSYRKPYGPGNPPPLSHHVATAVSASEVTEGFDDRDPYARFADLREQLRPQKTPSLVRDEAGVAIDNTDHPTRRHVAIQIVLDEGASAEFIKAQLVRKSDAVFGKEDYSEIPHIVSIGSPYFDQGSGYQLIDCILAADYTPDVLSSKLSPDELIRRRFEDNIVDALGLHNITLVKANFEQTQLRIDQQQRLGSTTGSSFTHDF